MLYVLFISILAARHITERFEKLSTAKQIRKLESLSIKSTLDLQKPPLSELLIPRVAGSKGNKKVQEYIIKTFQDLGWHIEQDKFHQNTPIGDIEFSNIIATSDERAHRKLVLACHFDSKYFKEFEFIGATDSAAPCSILIDVAQTLNEALKRRKESFNRFSAVQLIFFDGEEAFVQWTDTDSIYGARHLANKWSETMLTLKSPDGSFYQSSPLQQIDALILLDLLGAKNTQVKNSQSSTQWVWDRIVRIQEKLALLKLLSKDMLVRMESNNPYFLPGQPVLSSTAVQDDHVPFMNLGVPICHLIAYPFPSVWHSAADNADALDIDSIRDLALTFRILVAEYLGLIEYIE